MVTLKANLARNFLYSCKDQSKLERKKHTDRQIREKRGKWSRTKAVKKRRWTVGPEDWVLSERKADENE